MYGSTLVYRGGVVIARFMRRLILAARIRVERGSPISVGALCADVGRSRGFVVYRFRFSSGLPLWLWVRELRLVSAARMLERTSWPVRAIMLRVGYQSVHHFSVLFRARWGCSARAYRQRARLAGIVPGMPSRIGPRGRPKITATAPLTREIRGPILHAS